MVLRVLLLLGAAGAAAVHAEPPRAAEVYGTVGVMRFAGDEGSLGRAPIFGAGITLPFLPKLAFDMDVHTGRTRRDFGGIGLERRRTLVNPAIVYRFGSERLYGFVGGGIGASFTSESTSNAQFPFDSSDTSWTSVARGGVVGNPTGRLIVRFEVFSSWQFVLPNLGVKGGIGYRF